MRGLLAILSLFILLGTALGADPDETLEDPEQEARAREISKTLRCVVCQNQSIDDSDAPLARDLRLLVRERIVQGETNEEVLEYVVDRYGEFVLLKPRFEGEGIILWLSPFLILLIGTGMAVYYYRGNKAQPAAPAPLNREELQDLMKVLHEDKNDGVTPIPDPEKTGSDRS